MLYSDRLREPAVLTSGPTPVVSLKHPFGFALSAVMDVCYISNQDNVVVAVYGPKAVSPAVPGEPLPVNKWLNANFENTFLPGTFVPSQTEFLRRARRPERPRRPASRPTRPGSPILPPRDSRSPVPCAESHCWELRSSWPMKWEARCACMTRLA